MEKSMQHDGIVKKIAQYLLQQGWSMVCAESCTGGGLSYALTALPGSSRWFDGAFVSYSQSFKIDHLGVPQLLLDTHGAVSAACALAMARGAVKSCGADIGLAATGCAGPAGGTERDPVGTVWLALAGPAVSEQSWVLQLHGDRQAIRQQCVAQALDGLYQQLSAGLHKS